MPKAGGAHEGNDLLPRKDKAFFDRKHVRLAMRYYCGNQSLLKSRFCAPSEARAAAAREAT